VNVVIGGTGLGKTTLINATLFAVFGDLFRTNDSIGRTITPDYFASRVSSSATLSKKTPPQAEVDVEFGRSAFSVTRNLANGEIISVTRQGKKVTSRDYESAVCSALRIDSFDDHLERVLEHLLYASDAHYYLSWDVESQNDTVLLLFTDRRNFDESHKLWGQVQQADSAFRNARYQAGLLQKDLDDAALIDSPVSQSAVEGRRDALTKARDRAEKRVDASKSDVTAEENVLREAEERLEDARGKFEVAAKDVAVTSVSSPDERLVAFAYSQPIAGTSTYAALARFLSNGSPTQCPSCLQSPPEPTPHMAESAKLLAKHDCPICSLPLPSASTPKSAADGKALSAAEEFGDAVLDLRGQVEASRSRLAVLHDELRRAESEALTAAREEYDWTVKHPPAGDSGTQKRVAWRELVSRMEEYRSQFESRLIRFKTAQERYTSQISSLYKDLSAEFAYYAGLFLDEECRIELDTSGLHARRRGPQVDPSHVAFYPVISGTPRYHPEELSEAQRLFIDIAFRMAVIELWRKKTGKTVTFVIETPEGTVDLAYMVRVASMLRSFAAKGHTLIVTTNLNNEQFLPELFKATPKSERPDRILNMLELGRPRKLQMDHMKLFQKIVKAALREPYRRD
jgi:AAA domain